MTTPEPSWPPLAVLQAPLHLRFAITPSGPPPEHLGSGVEAVSFAQPAGSAWHELTVAALLVCLMAEETGIAAAAEIGALAAIRPVPPAQAEAVVLALPVALSELSGPILASEFGTPLHDGWMKLAQGRPGMDAAWLIS
ncbi:MAG: hypothetical protein K5Q68_12055 [Roseococcus sp.]|nr:hypothetical protein [Roseococcus sp.]